MLPMLEMLSACFSFGGENEETISLNQCNTETRVSQWNYVQLPCQNTYASLFNTSQTGLRAYGLIIHCMVLLNISLTLSAFPVSLSHPTYIYIHKLHNLTLPDEDDLDCDRRLHIDIDIPACLMLARVLPEGCIELYLFLERSLSLRVMEALGARVVRGEIVSADSAKFSKDTPFSEQGFDWTSRVTNDEFMSWFSTECLRVCFFSTFSTGLFSVVSLQGISSSFESTLTLGSLLLMLSVVSPSCGVVVEEGVSGRTGFSSGFTCVFSWGLFCGLTTGLGTETVSSVQHTDKITDKVTDKGVLYL